MILTRKIGTFKRIGPLIFENSGNEQRGAISGLVMAGNSSEVYGVGRPLDCPSSEALAEWRSSEQVDNGTPSTSPPYWDSDSSDDGGKPVHVLQVYDNCLIFELGFALSGLRKKS
ncbi:hypothetical protein RJ641_023446 [Dillenia turbinata]|uniref:Uncharacterized protein n=1 Tax=Dillenia turbinata TaxID=194707 RepID=A0AAN8UIT8_9MAGN